MTKRKTLKKFQQGRGKNKADMDAVSDNPKWTKADFAGAKYGDDMPDFIKETFKVRRTKGS